MREIGGEAATYIDPANIEAAAETVLSLLGRQNRPSKAGLENARRFDTANMIEGYSHMFEHLLRASQNNPQPEPEPVPGNASARS
jgi:hypothetical protein